MFALPGARARTLPRQRDLLGYQISAAPTAANSLIVTLNPVPGADPFLQFRNPTSSNGDPFFRTIPNGAQFIINSGNTMGATSGVAFRLWVLGFDNGGGISLGAINCVTGGAVPTATTFLDESTVQTTTSGNGGSSAGTFYCAQSLTSRPYRILGYLEWPTGLVTAGTWNVKPKVQLFGYGIKKPGDFTGNLAVSATGTVATGGGTFTLNNTIPVITNGTEFMAKAITPQSPANLLRISAQGIYSTTAATAWLIHALYQDATTNALAVSLEFQPTATAGVTIPLSVQIVANLSTSTTFRVRAGSDSVGTITFNGTGGSQLFGGVMNSYLRIEEIMA